MTAKLETYYPAPPRGWAPRMPPGLFRRSGTTKSLNIEWAALATVIIASIVMNEPSGGPGFGIADLGFAANRGMLGLLICYLLIPKHLQAGRYLWFFVLAGSAIASFGLLHIYGLSPLLDVGHDGRPPHSCYRCYLMQTMPTVATMAVVKLSWSLLEQQKQAAVIGQQRSDAELRFLRTQMNPHLLFNSLNNVYSYALEKSDRAPEMILKLSGVLRYMLYEASDETVPLPRELDYITDYFELQRLATEGRGEVTLAISGKTARLCIAPVVLIVFIENCFKHAVETTEPVSVHVSIRVEGETLTLETENNLPAPVSRSDPKRPGGIGLENVRRRLELLYPGKHDLRTWQTKDSYHARMRLTLDPA